jgi:hypothetical protein
MNHNPYAPPTAVIAGHTKRKITRPRTVSLAVILLWTSYGYDLFGDFKGQFFQSEGSFSVHNASVVMCMAALAAGLIAMIARGRKWAQITYFLLWTGTGTALAVISPREFLSDYWPIKAANLAGIAQLVGATTALVLLLTPSARDWFRARQAAEM